MECVLTQGLVHVYTGDGKGKTTAALGQAIRSIGQGLRVLIVQFLKDKAEISGELNSVKKLSPEITILRLDQKHPNFYKHADYNLSTLKLSVNKLFNIAKEAILNKKYDLIILDEINNVLKENLLDKEKIIDLIKTKPKQIELILTGRDALHEIIALADLVTEMKNLKHPFNQGIPARCGIEY